MSVVQIKGSVWFTMYGATEQIGIVLTYNGYEEKAYIGTVKQPSNQEADAQFIARRGAKFPLQQAIELIGVL